MVLFLFAHLDLGLVRARCHSVVTRAGYQAMDRNCAVHSFTKHTDQLGPTSVHASGTLISGSHSELLTLDRDMTSRVRL
jgi:hypothetical protein